MQTDEHVELDGFQQEAVTKIRAGGRVFLSSAAGFGKSEVIRQASTDNTVIAAPTGQSALNEGGATLHRLFKLPMGMPTMRDFSKVPKEVKELFGPDSPVDLLSIGEISMVRQDYFNLINKRLQLARQDPRPFGGLSVVVSGDGYQLPPIVSFKEKHQYYKEYGSPYAFASPHWSFDTVELKKSYRTVDERQLAMLNSIRKGDQHCGRALSLLQQEARPYNVTDDVIHLCYYRKDADDYNNYRYNELIGVSKTYKAQRSNVRDKWNELSVPLELNLKIGARVLIKANCQNGQYVNGSTAVVTLFGKDFVRVLLDNGNEVDVVEKKWEKKGMVNNDGELKEKVESSVTQIPILLGYAVSVHSMQGATLDHAALDVGRGSFSTGQTYCALSRMRDLRNLSFVRPVGRSDIKTDEEVKRFYASL